MNGYATRGSVKTSVICYLCNATFGNSQLLQNHIKQCGSMLEVCPDKCGAWVERRTLQSHSLQCPLRNPRQAQQSKAPSTSSPYGSTGQPEKVQHDNTLQFNRQLDSFRLSLADEKLQREQLQNEVYKLKRQYNLSEERNQILLTTLSVLRKTLDEESMKKSISIDTIRQDLDHVQQSSRHYFSQLEMGYDALQKGIEKEQIERSHLELIVNGQDAKLRVLQAYETSIESIRNDILVEKQVRNDQMIRMENEKAETEKSTREEFLYCKHKIKNIEKFNGDVLRKLDQNSNDASKYQLVHFESKSLKTAVEEDSVKIENLHKTVSELTNMVTTLQRERHPDISNRDIQHNVMDYTGHLIWRIDNYEDKLKDSVDNESVFLSPLFKTSQYGYTVQAELYLNGLGKWRGRHLTASVFIVPGEHDPLLEWPPTLQANIILKDQATKRNKSVKAIDIVKTLMVKKKETFDTRIVKHESSAFKSNGDRRTLDIATTESEKKSLDATIRRQYVFIPHTSLDKFEYIKNNIMFIEIIVSNC